MLHKSWGISLFHIVIWEKLPITLFISILTKNCNGRFIHDNRWAWLTCWPLMVATGIEEEGAMLLSGVTAMCVGTLGGTARWLWPTLGAGAMSRLGMGDFMAAWRGNTARGHQEMFSTPSNAEFTGCLTLLMKKLYAFRGEKKNNERTQFSFCIFWIASGTKPELSARWLNSKLTSPSLLIYFSRLGKARDTWT